MRLTASKAANVVDANLVARTIIGVLRALIDVRTRISISGKSGVTKSL